MNLNHLNLCVADVAATRDFFVRYFGFRCDRPHDALSILANDAGFVLTVMKAKPEHTTVYPGSFHLGFYVDTGTVHALHDAMSRDGKKPGEIMSAPRRGTLFYVSSPNDILVEVCCPAA